jgi:NAD(P)-dependent dehydrogenase (short-subunit alcohol dehydrogenase family)
MTRSAPPGSGTPQRCYALPDEIAGAAVFLLDHRKASFVTGHIRKAIGPGLLRHRYSRIRVKS